MIIRSRFKDYYDFVAGTYGGGDPRIVYVRDRIEPLDRGMFGGVPMETWKRVQVDQAPISDPAVPIWGQQEFTLRCLVIAGKGYLLYRPGSPFLRTRDLNGLRVVEPQFIEKKIKLRYHWEAKKWLDSVLEWHGKETKALVELCRLVKAPVFVIESIERAYKGKVAIAIYGQCPILNNLGIPALIPPTEMYQTLAYFMGNLMHVSPDKAPPVEVSNEQKILKGGFDTRWSFRHRPRPVETVKE